MSLVDLTTVVPVDQMKGEDEDETGELLEMLEEARQFLNSFSWCEEIREEYFGLGIGGIVAVFLFRIQPTRTDVDEWLWVIVGDLPPAYLVTDANPNPPCALAGYVVEMLRWIHAVRRGRSIEKRIPVNTPATTHYADMLDSRLQTLCEDVLRARYTLQLRGCHWGRQILKYGQQ